MNQPGIDVRVRPTVSSDEVSISKTANFQQRNSLSMSHPVLPIPRLSLPLKPPSQEKLLSPRKTWITPEISLNNYFRQGLQEPTCNEQILRSMLKVNFTRLQHLAKDVRDEIFSRLLGLFKFVSQTASCDLLEPETILSFHQLLSQEKTRTREIDEILTRCGDQLRSRNWTSLANLVDKI